MSNKATAEDLNKALDEGKTIIVATCLRATKITAKTRAKFAAVGIDFFREHNGLEMASGRKYVDISLCSIRIYS